MALLEVRELESAYGESRVLFGLSLDVSRGEVVALLGRNGAGKTTTLASIMGLVKPRAGSIRFDGAERVRERAAGISPKCSIFSPTRSTFLSGTPRRFRAANSAW
jgi:branched-chain amino acid transport system ATP-binding protein